MESSVQIYLTFFLLIMVFGGTARGGKIENDLLRGAHFKALAFQYPPLMSAFKDPNDSSKTLYEGLSVCFIDYIAQAFNLSLEYVQENSTEVAKIGQINAVYKIVERKERSRFFINALWTIIGNLSLLGFTTVAYQENYQLISPWPKEESRLTAIIKPYDFKTWMMIAISTLILALFVTLLGFFYRYYFSPKLANKTASSFSDEISNSLMYTVSIQLQQGSRLSADKMAHLTFRVVLGFWLLMAVVLINLYTSTITSYLTVTKFEPIAITLEELVNHYELRHKKCMLTMQKGHPLMSKLRSSEYGPYKEIIKWSEKHPEFFTNMYDEVTENIVNKSCIHIGTVTSSGYRINSDFKQYGKCRMAFSRPIDSRLTLYFALQKNSRFTSIVNHSIMQAMEAGLIEYWKKWSNGAQMVMDTCKITANQLSKDEKPKPIKLIELSSALLVLGVGFGLAMFFFLLEKIIFIAKMIFH